MHGRMNGLTDACTHHRKNTMTIARWPLASGAKNTDKQHFVPQCFQKAHSSGPHPAQVAQW